MAGAAHAAPARAGDAYFCPGHYLTHGTGCVSAIYHDFINTSSAIGDLGTSVCAGVTNRGQQIGEYCVSYGRATCSRTCYGGAGYAYEHNHSSWFSDKFTGIVTFNGY